MVGIATNFTTRKLKNVSQELSVRRSKVGGRGGFPRI